jgi:HD-GYP domain-containing protein (c-di-GMP phosphodiesterase class II)
MKRNKFSNWREDLREVVDVPSSEPKTDKKSERKIDTKEVKNKIVINPQMTEAFDEIGATILEVTELDEKLSAEDLKRMQDEKDKKEGRKPGKVEENLEALMMRRAKKEADIAKTDMKIAKERKKSAQSPTQVQERTLSSDEKEEKERIVKGMKKSKGGFEKRYGDDAKSVMYATATKLAKEERNPEVEAQGKKVAGYEKEGKYKGIVDKFRKENPGSRQPKQERGSKPSEGDRQAAQRSFRNKLQSKYGRTKAQEREAKIMSKHTSARD